MHTHIHTHTYTHTYTHIHTHCMNIYGSVSKQILMYFAWVDQWVQQFKALAAASFV